MDKKRILLATYCTYLLFIGFSIIKYFLGKNNQNSFLFFPYLLCIIFLAIALPEVFKSSKIKNSEKIMWLVNLTLVFPVGGLVYLINGRNRVLSK